MAKKRTSYSAEFKVKIVLEVLKNEKSINQIAKEHNILPKNIINWKKQFLENAQINRTEQSSKRIQRAYKRT